MSAPMRMVVDGITPVIIKLINKSNGQCTDDPDGQGGKEILSVYFIGDVRTNKVRDYVDGNDKQRCNDKVPQFHVM